jgi:hypothetical protein
MKKIYYTLALLSVLLINISLGYSQRRSEMPRQKMHEFLKKTLSVDSVKAEQVLQIMLVYKANVKRTIDSSSLAPEVKAQQIQTFIKEKNHQLEAILSKEQQAKIIPTTERDSTGTSKPGNKN